jgi:hypothetical protein
VIVIAGASSSGETQLIRKMNQQPHNLLTLKVLKKLDCDPNQRLKRCTIERMQRLMNPANFKKQKTQKLEYYRLLHIELTSINHDSNLKQLRQISTRAKRLDIVTLYTSPKEWHQPIFDRLHTDNEPSKQGGFIALSAKLSSNISDFLYHRKYNKWLKIINNYNIHPNGIVNMFEQSPLKSIPPS